MHAGGGVVSEPTLALPVQVLERLRTADSLRAEVAGLTAERAALREELDRAAWERDTAQSEAAALRDDVLHRDGYYSHRPANLGLILTTGDVPPPPPDDEHGDDIALVSLTTGELYLRPHRRLPDQWCRYGNGVSVTDFATLGEKGPWITVGTWAVRDHAAVVERDRRLREATYSIRLGWADVPESAQSAIERVNLLKGRGPLNQAEPSEWIEALNLLAGAFLSAWRDEHKALEALEALRSAAAETEEATA